MPRSPFAKQLDARAHALSRIQSKEVEPDDRPAAKARPAASSRQSRAKLKAAVHKVATTTKAVQQWSAALGHADAPPLVFD